MHSAIIHPRHAANKLSSTKCQQCQTWETWVWLDHYTECFMKAVPSPRLIYLGSHNLENTLSDEWVSNVEKKK